MGQPIVGSNPTLSATPDPHAARGDVVSGAYDLAAVLGGELAVPCTCNPLQQG